MHAARSNRTSANRDVPNSVNRVLGSSGEPLAESVRRKLEPRFEHDFSSVRVHSDRDAAQSTVDLHARAWTVGNHIAFAPQMYAPQTTEGMQLLAHELAHVAQQSSSPRTSSLTVGTPHDPSEIEADRAASAVSRGEKASVSAHDGAVVRGQFDWEDPLGLEHDPWPEKTQARKIRMEHPAGRSLSKEEVEAAEKATGTTAPATPAGGSNPIFVVHDTAGGASVSHIKGLTGAGAKGTGVKAWAPRTEDPVDTRPGGFFEGNRPTATGYEKGEDIIREGPRERNFNRIWKATSKTERDAALDRAVANTPGLSADDSKKLKNATNSFLMSLVDPKVDGSGTTAAWAVTDICQRINSAGAAAVADPKNKDAEKTLTDTCGDQKMVDWFASRDRVAQRTNVEIVQVSDTAPIPKPPYTDKQYESVASIYLQAALAARRWPYVSTHKYEDRDIIGGHQDPRCFNLGRLYELIASKVAHPMATVYGLEPKYGAFGDKNANISWSKSMCHADKPA